MNVKVIEPSEKKTYPCLVIDSMVGDGENPTIYLKPAPHISIVVKLGYMGDQMEWNMCQVFDSNDARVFDDLGVDAGDPIHDELPLFKGKIVLEN